MDDVLPVRLASAMPTRGGGEAAKTVDVRWAPVRRVDGVGVRGWCTVDGVLGSEDADEVGLSGFQRGCI